MHSFTYSKKLFCWRRDRDKRVCQLSQTICLHFQTKYEDKTLWRHWLAPYCTADISALEASVEHGGSAPIHRSTPSLSPYVTRGLGVAARTLGACPFTRIFQAPDLFTLARLYKHSFSSLSSVLLALRVFSLYDSFFLSILVVEATNGFSSYTKSSSYLCSQRLTSRPGLGYWQHRVMNDWAKRRGTKALGPQGRLGPAAKPLVAPVPL